MYKILLFSFLLVMGVSLHAQDELETHKELRSLLDGIENSINTQKYSELSQYFHKDLRVTTINQEVISSSNEIDEYFNRWFGEEGYLANLKIKLDADALTEFYSNNSYGIVRGFGKESYILSDGRTFDMKTRWTATVTRDDADRWVIISLHIGTNFLDNPILKVAEDSMLYTGIGGGVAGLIIGLFIGFLWFRRASARKET
ncbi:MAG: hypothetical protein DRI32_07765 [Chloroflexi bacterium]|nr:MAG: hypothetical protein DRI32_07765 [Chloroflexota bacterium]